MKKVVFAGLLLVSSAVISSPIWAQTKLTPRNTVARVDNCIPIGKTANGTLVYSMKCENLPAPPPPPPQAEAAPAPAAPPEPVVERSGLFGLSYTVKQPDQ